MSKKDVRHDMNLLSDAALLALWLHGDERAFDFFYLRHVTDLVNLAAKKTGSRETARELVQDVFLDVFRQKDRLDPQKEIKGYLYACLRNRIFNHYRGVVTRKKHEQNLDLKIYGGHNETEQQIVYKELTEILQQGIESLPSKCREVFLLSRNQHLSHKEIAGRLNISVNTVEQHMRKALQRLRISIQHYNIWLISGIVSCSAYFLLYEI